MGKVTVFIPSYESDFDARYGPHVFDGELTLEQVRKVASWLGSGFMQTAIRSHPDGSHFVTFCVYDNVISNKAVVGSGEEFTDCIGCAGLAYNVEFRDVHNFNDIVGTEPPVVRAFSSTSAPVSDDPPPLPEDDLEGSCDIESEQPAKFVFANLEMDEENNYGAAVTLYFTGDLDPTLEQIVAVCKDLSLPFTVDTNDPAFKYKFCPNVLSGLAGTCRVQCYPTG